ncbi:hypothetical protein FVE85_0526 [Porphyridium purpureum]|uniref:Uncharacterized protein n=1 Tax=Porphyridium purpureum TaxID=35688 RepID=A0A5J4Z2B1_PORPP|nr:hypothetical protein FVE85_0526 [Porphyridium purpureum]|eukprot:POR1639..scf208_2
MLRMRSAAAGGVSRMGEPVLVPIVPVVVCAMLSVWLLVASLQLWRCRKGRQDRVWKVSDVPADLYDMITHISYLTDSGASPSEGSAAMRKMLASERALKKLCPCRNFGDSACECDWSELLRRATRLALSPKLAKKRKTAAKKLGVAHMCPEDGRGLLPPESGYQCVFMTLDYLVFPRVALQQAVHAVSLLSLETPFLRAADAIVPLLESFPDGSLDVHAFSLGDVKESADSVSDFHKFVRRRGSSTAISARHMRLTSTGNRTLYMDTIRADVQRRYDFIQLVCRHGELLTFELLEYLYAHVAPGGFMALVVEMDPPSKKGNVSPGTMQDLTRRFVKAAASRTEGYVLPVFVQSAHLGRKKGTMVVVPHLKGVVEGAMDWEAPEMDDGEADADGVERLEDDGEGAKGGDEEARENVEAFKE